MPRACWISRRNLAKLGLVIEAFGGSAIAVRETPAILGRVNAAALLRDILDDLADLGGSDRLQARMDAVLVAHGLPRLGPVGPPDAGRGNERPAARDGGDPACRASATTGDRPMSN